MPNAKTDSLSFGNCWSANFFCRIAHYFSAFGNIFKRNAAHAEVSPVSYADSRRYRHVTTHKNFFPNRNIAGNIAMGRYGGIISKRDIVPYAGTQKSDERAYFDIDSHPKTILN